MVVEEHKDLINYVSTFSDDENRKVGCIIVSEDSKVVSYGSNTIPLKVNKEDYRLEKPIKYKWVGHAERNAISKAAKKGISTNNSTMYCNYFPCSDCAISIIEAGIKKVYTTEPDFNHVKWGESWEISKTMFDESGVEIEYIKF